MTPPKLRVNLKEPTIDTNLPITDGTVQVEGFDVELVEEEPDAWDQGFGALLGLHLAGAPVVSIPAFPNRKFRQSYIQVRDDAGIEEPKDLEGRRVGLLAWDNTAAIWARGALQNHYGVDLEAISWLSVKDRVAIERAGCKVQPLPEHRGSSDALLEGLLLEGEIDAVISPNVLAAITRRDRRLRRLFRDYRAAEQSYFRETGIFPISHVMTLRADYVERHPEAPVALLRAFRRARDVAFDRIEGSDPVVLTLSWASAAMAEQRQLMGDDYWPYNVVDNAVALGALVRFAHQQGVTPHQLGYERFFDPSAAALAGR